MSFADWASSPGETLCLICSSMPSFLWAKRKITAVHCKVFSGREFRAWISCLNAWVKISIPPFVAGWSGAEVTWLIPFLWKETLCMWTEFHRILQSVQEFLPTRIIALTFALPVLIQWIPAQYCRLITLGSNCDQKHVLWIVQWSLYGLRVAAMG